MKPAISIVIPIYNASAYLSELLDSIIDQTHSDFEVIAVNDGSRDDSLSILQTYAAKDCRIRIIDKPNTGVSDTRNIGITAASGEYLCCVDADDVLSPDYLKAMYTLAVSKQADMVVCGYQTFRGTMTFARHAKAYEYRIGCAQELLKTGRMISIWTKLIRLDVIKQYSIKFNTSMTFGEDLFFCWKAFITAQNVWMTNQTLYGYRMSGNSAIRRYHPNLYEKYKASFIELKAFHIALKADYAKERHEIDVFFTQQLHSFLMMTIREKSSLSAKYKRLRHILQDSVIQAVLQDSFQELSADKGSQKLFRYAKNGKICLLLLEGYIREFRCTLGKLLGKLIDYKLFCAEQT